MQDMAPAPPLSAHKGRQPAYLLLCPEDLPLAPPPPPAGDHSFISAQNTEDSRSDGAPPEHGELRNYPYVHWTKMFH
ncbi:hypothetical protein MRX96_018249 [Rhipicephalus microplus]